VPPIETAPDPRAPAPEAVREAPTTSGGNRAVPGSPGGAAGVAVRAQAAVPPDDAVARLLEALTYAVLALAGFAAAIMIVLLRITMYLARIAERS
jgi:hypothetical protein